MSTPRKEIPLHTQQARERFSGRAGDYARARPSYPAEAIDAVLRDLGDPARLVIADIGAGTGLSTRLLAERGAFVEAVEPNAPMRDAAAPHPRIRWHASGAEDTGLSGASIDVVVCAQAFHWFEGERALAEFARILKPRGRLALLWNDRDQSDPATAEYSRIILEASCNHPAAVNHTRPGPLLASPLFECRPEEQYPNTQRLDREGLIARAASASYFPASGPAHDEGVGALRALHDRAADSQGIVTLRYLTRVFIAEKRSARAAPAAAPA